MSEDLGFPFAAHGSTGPAVFPFLDYQAAEMRNRCARILRPSILLTGAKVMRRACRRRTP